MNHEYRAPPPRLTELHRAHFWLSNSFQQPRKKWKSFDCLTAILGFDSNRHNRKKVSKHTNKNIGGILATLKALFLKSFYRTYSSILAEFIFVHLVYPKTVNWISCQIGTSIKICWFSIFILFNWIMLIKAITVCRWDTKSTEKISKSFVKRKNWSWFNHPYEWW